MPQNDPPFMTIRKRRLWNYIQMIERSYWLIPAQERSSDLVQYIADGLSAAGLSGRGDIIRKHRWETPEVADRLALAMRAIMRGYIDARQAGEWDTDDVQMYVAHRLTEDGWYFDA